MADLALVLELLERCDRTLVRDLGIRAVQLIELDCVQTQPPQRALAGLPEVLGAAIPGPLPWAGAPQPPLGGDHQILGIRIEGLGDQLLADVRPVRVRGVDQVDAQLHRAPQDGNGLAVVRRRSPDAGTGNPHRAEAEPAHPAIADLDRAHVLVSDRHAAASNASFSNWSARSFSPRFTCRMDQLLRSRNASRTLVWSGRRWSCFTLQLPRTCSTISLESPTNSTSSAPSSLARSIPSRSARYSATLLVASPIVSARSASTLPAESVATAAIPAGPGLPREPPSTLTTTFRPGLPPRSEPRRSPSAPGATGSPRVARTPWCSRRAHR